MSKLTVFFDEKCNFCVTVKNIIKKLDTEAQISFKSLSENSNELMAVDENGNIYFSEDAMIEIAKILPGIKRFSWMFDGKAGKKAGELFYSGIESIKKVHNRIHGKPPCIRC